MNGFVTVPLMLCFMLTTWNSIASNKKLTYHLSGEEMFRGVFFVEGKYAELIPELKAANTAYLTEQLSAEENAALSSVRTQIIESIKAENPHYFDDFKATLQIASPSLVKEKIVEAQALLTKKAFELSKLSNSEMKEDVQAAEAFLAKQQANGVDKNAVKKFMNQLAKDNANSKVNNGTGACIAILLLIVVVVVIVVVVPLAEEMATASSKNPHNLLLEQIVSSVCIAAPQVV
jgi:SdpC family antimicrobial peptide